MPAPRLLMKLNHINLTVESVAETSAFFVRYFDFRVVETPPGMIVLRGVDDFLLVLMPGPSGQVPQYPKSFHVGFTQETRADVEAMYARLKADDIELGKPPKDLHHAYTFYGTAPGPIFFEVASYPEPD